VVKASFAKQGGLHPPRSPNVNSSHQMQRPVPGQKPGAPLRSLNRDAARRAITTLSAFRLSGFPVSGFGLSGFVLSGFVLSGFVLSGFVLSG